jgi:hypothetical protein
VVAVEELSTAAAVGYPRQAGSYITYMHSTQKGTSVARAVVNVFM